MSGFLVYDTRPVYIDSTGQVAAGGSLVFSMAGTATPQDVYGDSDLTVNNGSTLTLGTDGRTAVEVWGDPTLSYRIQLYDANGALVFDQDNVNGSSGAGSSGAIPDLVVGKFLTNDGSQLLWADIRQLPDPTGQADKVLSTDGTNFTWITKPADGAPGAAGTNAAVTVTTALAKVGDGTSDMLFMQMGSDTAPASGIPSTSKAITFPTVFKTTPRVFVITTGNSYATDGKLGITAITAKTTAGFTVSFDTNTTTDNIFAAVPFDWLAIGTIANG